MIILVALSCSAFYYAVQNGLDKICTCDNSVKNHCFKEPYLEKAKIGSSSKLFLPFFRFFQKSIAL